MPSNAGIMDVLQTKWFLFTIVSLLTIFMEYSGAQKFVPPTPTVEPLYPKGIRMSIPHEDGITLVAYHVKINEDFMGLEAGTIAIDIIRMRNSRWTYEDRTTRLKQGDIVYYWIHVVYDGLGYNLVDKHHVVTDFYDYDGNPYIVGPPTSTVGPCTATSPTNVYYNGVKGYDVCPGQLIFDENFDSLNRSLWTIVERFSGPPHYEFVVYMDIIETMNVKDGALHIKPILTDYKYGEGFSHSGQLDLENCTAERGSYSCKRKAFSWNILPPIISGRIITKPAFSFLYGRIQVRAKLPRGDWIYPLISLDTSEGRSENSSYCDIIIAHSNGNAALRAPDGIDLSGHILVAGALVTDKEHSNKEHLPVKVSNTLWSNEYHVYELEWRSGQISVKVDDIQYGQQKIPVLYDRAVYLNFGLAVGGQILFPDMSVTGHYVKPWRNVGSKAVHQFYHSVNDWLDSWKQGDTGLHIDYVKVWAL